MYSIKKNIIIFISLFILSFLYIVIRVYFFVICYIPSSSMYPTLQRGDYIIASLQIPGRRAWHKNKNGILTIKRKKGIRPVKKEDIVIFNYPFAESEEKILFDANTFYCKRCVALPGEKYFWELDNKIDSIYVPKFGDVLIIDTTNYHYYKKSIEYETGKKLVLQNKQVSLGNIIIQNYCFQNNYYFLRGDNQAISYDSRIWGILPEDFILAVGKYICFSKDSYSHKIQWNKFFKSI